LVSGMNRNDFLELMNDSARVNRQLIGEVYELIDIFPYFQTAHMLLLKGLQDSADVKFENQLRNSAIHIADRERLYHLLRSKKLQVDEQPEIPQAVSLPVVSDADTQQTVIETAKNSEDLITEYEKSSGEIPADEPSGTASHPAGHPILVSSGENYEEQSGVMLVIEEESPESEEKVFFMDPGISASGSVDLLELDLDDDISPDQDEYIFEQGMSDIPEEVSRKQLQSDLIDKFILANPRIEPAREKSALPVEDISKPFVEQEGGFVTETLARIYFSQGYYSRAIDIYEKLSLKFPEKSSYFASQIEKVKEYIKN
jgi:hypothetical protein